MPFMACSSLDCVRITVLRQLFLVLHDVRMNLDADKTHIKHPKHTLNTQ